MLEKLMFKREYFPLELLDYDGKPFRNTNIIPPFHRKIIENGIDLDVAFSVIDEAVENTLLDLEETALRTDVPRPQFGVDGKIKYGPIKRTRTEIYLPEFPFTGGLCIQKDRISPYGGDYYLIIDKNSPTISYMVPKELPIPIELLKEYRMTQESYGNYFRIRGKKGWKSHNVDFRDVFYKNLVIALNNTIVRAKYSD